MTVPARDSGDWRDRAACTDHHPELWFPESGGRGVADPYRHARAICGSCTVRDDCLTDALRVEGDGYPYGMRGGLSPEQRLQVRRRSA